VLDEADSSHMELNCLATGMNSCQNLKIESPDEQGGGQINTE